MTGADHANGLEPSATQPLSHSSCAADDWRAYQDGRFIPSKGIKLPPIFFETLSRLEEQPDQQQMISHDRTAGSTNSLDILELGCGCGELSKLLQERGHNVTGIDVNSNAIELARQSCPQATFFVEDVTSNQQNVGEEVANLNDFCILQLVLSVVGGPSERQQTLQYAISRLKPETGTIYLSCSGVSDDINESYAKLYRQDAPETGEEYSYYSRDAKTGKVLYTTHHFTVQELRDLLERVGFVNVCIQQIKEASSRRPNEAAYFLYATATKPAR